MAFDYTSDLNTMFNTSEFAEPAIYTPVGLPARDITVILDNEFVAAQGMGVVGVDSSAPQAFCKASDVYDASRGATLSIRGDIYNVTEIMPDGTGMTVLRLSKD